MKFQAILALGSLLLGLGCGSCACAETPAGMQPARSGSADPAAARFRWDNATVYFVLTDRFANARPGRPAAYGRQNDAAPLRGFQGGDLAGISEKIRSGYFERLGVDVLWISPVVEQIHAAVDEGTGKTYGFHGYWARDFTALDASLGSRADLHELVDTAHAHGIRVLLDVVMNHVGPATDKDPAWPASWVRTEPVCSYKDSASTISCALVKNLPDIRTDSNETVELPPALLSKWQAEGRAGQELSSLDAFFKRTGLPRAPRYYLMKWQTDWVREFGFDGFRVDTVKHVEASVWAEFAQLARAAFQDWKQQHPASVLPGDLPFYLTGEVYGYQLADGQAFRLDGGEQVNYFRHGFDSLINFGFIHAARSDYETLFAGAAARLHTDLAGYSVLNYLSSHDDMAPFDSHREQPFQAANKLLLSPGAAQIYYGDESSRLLDDSRATGDARLRSPMNWQALAANLKVQAYPLQTVLAHWQRLGQFRHRHPAIGAGAHQQLTARPYTFSRRLQQGSGTDQVVIALDVQPDEPVRISVAGVFADGSRLLDRYSGQHLLVNQGAVQLARPGMAVLLEQE